MTVYIYYFTTINKFHNTFPLLCSALEDSMPEEAIQLYTDACTTLEDDGREQMVFDLYRAAANVYIKLEK